MASDHTRDLRLGTAGRRAQRFDTHRLRHGGQHQWRWPHIQQRNHRLGFLCYSAFLFRHRQQRRRGAFQLRPWGLFRPPGRAPWFHRVHLQYGQFRPEVRWIRRLQWQFRRRARPGQLDRKQHLDGRLRQHGIGSFGAGGSGARTFFVRAGWGGHCGLLWCPWPAAAPALIGRNLRRARSAATPRRFQACVALSLWGAFSPWRSNRRCNSTSSSGLPR